MKVLITTDWYKPAINGVVTSVLNLESELRSRGHEVKIVTLSQDFISRKEKNVYFLKSVNMGRLYPYARASCFLNKTYLDELIKWKPDIIHSQCEFSTFYVAKKISNILQIPVVHTYHTVYEDYTHYFAPSRVWSKKIVACFSRGITNHAQSVVVPTNKVKELLVGYGTTTDINVIPTGISLEKYARQYNRQTIESLKERIGISPSNKVLVAIGRLAKEKNIEELIDYFGRLQLANLCFLIVGDGPYGEELRQYAQDSPASDKIFFTGMVDPKEIPLYYQLGDAFVCASKSETQGMTYIEALASGLPVICRKDQCVDGIVCNDENGYQYETFEEYEKAVCSILTDKIHYAELSANAAGSVKPYSTECFAEGIENVYFRVTSQPKETRIN